LTAHQVEHTYFCAQARKGVERPAANYGTNIRTLESGGK